MRQTGLIFACWLGAVALAMAGETTKTNITMASGVVYTNVIVLRVEPDGLSLMLPTGIKKILIAELAPEVREVYKQEGLKVASEWKIAAEKKLKQDAERKQNQKSQFDEGEEGQTATEKAAIEKAIRKHKVLIGMTRGQVIQSWGVPKDVNRTVTDNTVSEQWCYGDKTYLYFDNGIFKSWQD